MPASAEGFENESYRRLYDLVAAGKLTDEEIVQQLEAISKCPVHGIPRQANGTLIPPPPKPHNKPWIPVGVFWDYENCSIPATSNAFQVVKGIRNIAMTYGRIVTFKAYWDSQQTTSEKYMQVRRDLWDCAVTTIDCPRAHPDEQDTADTMILLDMFMFAKDRAPPPAVIVVISGDRDFVIGTSKLIMLGFQVVVIGPNSSHESLKRLCSKFISWNEEVLPPKPEVQAPVDPLFPLVGRSLLDIPLALDLRTESATAAETAYLEAIHVAFNIAVSRIDGQRQKRVRVPEPKFVALVQWLEALRVAHLHKSRIPMREFTHCFKVGFLRLPGITTTQGLESYLASAEKEAIVLMIRAADFEEALDDDWIALHPDFHGAPKATA
ncbi:hypothetical protein EIP91_007485 [Steccherinum ochraceum]|uniref:NYN domain-containing protein n=1 Tax=Steccherinum ochraceum TaxID=92696 RepID=A0A4R0R9Y0_9APHY|nr:hypothetical protein EIP91_007485 [Steccherinum ochraceum]